MRGGTREQGELRQRRVRKEIGRGKVIEIDVTECAVHWANGH